MAVLPRAIQKMLSILFFLLLGTSLLLGQDADALLKKAKSDLNKSNSLIMSGRYKDVPPKLVEIDKMIATAQKADPGNSRLSGVISTFMKQKDKVEKKLGQTVAITFDPAATGKAAAATKSTAATTSKQSNKNEKLPYPARQPMSKFDQAYTGFNSNVESYQTADADFQKSLMKRMNNKVSEMEKYLAIAREEAEKKGVTSHPDFTAADQKLTETRGVLASMSDSHAKKVAAASAAAGKAQADSKSLSDLYQSLSASIFDKATGTAMYYNKAEETEPLLKAIEAFEKNDKAKAEKASKNFAAKYGNTRDAIIKSTNDNQAWYAYQGITEGIVNVAKTREAMTASLLEKYESGFGNLKSGHDFFIVEMAGKLEIFIDYALRFSPNDPAAKKAKTAYKGRVDKALSAFYAKVDKQTFPSTASNAPSDAAELEAVALKWFKNSKDWGQRNQNSRAEDKENRMPLATVVTGPWSVQKKNLLGEPIMYGLPVRVAVQLQSEKKLNLVRVYDLTMRTAEKAGVKQAPPFVSLTVGNSYYIRPAALK